LNTRDSWALPSRVSYVLWRQTYVGLRPRFRAFYHYVVRGHTGETCERCGRPVEVAWLADDALWLEVVGSEGGISCNRCFDRELERCGTFVRWRPELGK
jgi:hypothetical protein